MRRALSETPGLSRDDLASISDASKSAVGKALAALAAIPTAGRYGTKTWRLPDDAQPTLDEDE